MRSHIRIIRADVILLIVRRSEIVFAAKSLDVCERWLLIFAWRDFIQRAYYPDPCFIFVWFLSKVIISLFDFPLTHLHTRKLQERQTGRRKVRVRQQKEQKDEQANERNVPSHRVQRHN